MTAMRGIILTVSREAGVSVMDIRSARRDAASTRARMICCWLARRHTPLSLPAIGRRLGGRDHSTVRHAIRRIEEIMAHDESAARLARRREARLARRETKPEETTQ